MWSLLASLVVAAPCASADVVSSSRLGVYLQNELEDAPHPAAIVAMGSDTARQVERALRDLGSPPAVHTVSPVADRDAEYRRVRRTADAPCLLVVRDKGGRVFSVSLDCVEPAPPDAVGAGPAPASGAAQAPLRPGPTYTPPSFADAPPGASSPDAKAPPSPFTFSRVVYRLDQGQEIGTRWSAAGKIKVRWGDDLAVTSTSTAARLLTELRGVGLPARGAEDLVFGRDRSAEARFVLGGEVDSVKVEALGGPFVGGGHSVRVRVRWQVYDRVEDHVVAELLHSGSAQAPALDGGLLDRAVLDAGKGLARDGRFLDALRVEAPVAVEAVAFGEPLRIPGCDRGPLRLPDELPDAIAATHPVLVGEASGTAVMISPDGWLLTAAHVVDGADQVLVTLGEGGPSLPAEVVRVQPASDVALLRLPGQGYPCLTVGSAPSVGESIHALGVPVDSALGVSISRGIVSGRRKGEVLGLTVPALIQTDASISPGASGGPLLGPDGTVDAVITMKLVGGGVEGIGFGVPIDVVLEGLELTVE